MSKRINPNKVLVGQVRLDRETGLMIYVQKVSKFQNCFYVTGLYLPNGQSFTYSLRSIRRMIIVKED